MSASSPTPRIPTDAEWTRRATDCAIARSQGRAWDLELLPAHASLRRYARLHFERVPEILMMLPDSAGPEEAGGAAAARASDEPFVATQRWLLSLGMPVPVIFDVDDERNVIWLEDVGHNDLDAWVTANPSKLRATYESAIDLLADFQDRTLRAEIPETVSSRVFGADILRWELEHYVEWRLEADLKRTISPGQRAVFDAEFSRLVELLAAVPLRVMHRDYQSHNLMVLPSSEPHGLVMLDFQDMMLGPAVYDAVALLRDSYVALPAELLSSLVDRFAGRVNAREPGISASDVKLWFTAQALQRKLKDSGRFVFIDRVKGNSSFLKYIPRSLGYVADALAQLPDFHRLREVLLELDPLIAEPRDS